jgi:cation/acetate symporter
MDVGRNGGRAAWRALGSALGWALAIAGVGALAAGAAALETWGAPWRPLGLALLAVPALAYVATAVRCRARDAEDFLVARRGIGAVPNGIASAATWISAATFVGLAGTLHLQGQDGTPFVLAWAAGWILAATLIAPGLNRSGALSVPDYMAARFGGGLARGVAVVVLAWCSFTFLVAQFAAMGTLGTRFLGLPYPVAVLAGGLLALACVLPGGMRSLTWTQALQGAVILAAYLLPAGLIGFGLAGDAAAPAALGEGAVRIGGLAAASGTVDAPGDVDGMGSPALLLCLALGTASLPHLLMRSLAAPTPGSARGALCWGLLLVMAVYLTAPSYAAFARAEIEGSVLGARIDSLAAARELPRWIYEHGRLGLVSVCGQPPVTAGAVVDACLSHQAAAVAAGTLPREMMGLLGAADLSLHPDGVMLAASDMAGLPKALAVLVAAGALAAALSTATALLMALGTAAGHDLWHRMTAPAATPQTRIRVLRWSMAALAALAAHAAASAQGGVLALVGWAFSLAASGLFPALALGLWWRRCSEGGAVAGMITGFGIALWYLVRTEVLGQPPIIGIDGIAAGAFGVPAGFAVTVVVSLLGPAPARSSQGVPDAADAVPRATGR